MVHAGARRRPVGADREDDVLDGCQPWQQAVVLVDHPDLPPKPREVELTTFVYGPSAYVTLAPSRFEVTVDEGKERGLP